MKSIESQFFSLKIKWKSKSFTRIIIGLPIPTATSVITITIIYFEVKYEMFVHSKGWQYNEFLVKLFSNCSILYVHFLNIFYS